MELRGEPFFSEEQRRAFARDLIIPTGIQVWIARRNAGYVTARYMSVLRRMQPTTPIAPHLTTLPLSPYRFEIYDCIFSIGYLLLQVAAARWTEREVANSLDFPPIDQGEFFDRYAIQIWPTDNLPIRWPPPLAVGNDMFALFCSRLENFTLPEWMR